MSYGSIRFILLALLVTLIAVAGFSGAVPQVGRVIALATVILLLVGLVEQHPHR